MHDTKTFFSSFAAGIFLMLLFLPLTGDAMERDDASVPLSDADAYIFVRDDCTHCQDLKEFVNEQKVLQEDYAIAYIDIALAEGRALFDEATTALKTSKVTPIALVGGQVYVGFAENVLGEALLTHADDASRPMISFAEYLTDIPRKQEVSESCDEEGLVPCVVDQGAVHSTRTITIPVFGTISPQATSLSTLAIVLGFVDGFNPCAMWVLLTFLIILSQVGSRKKMVQIAGLFIVAEGIMYFFILNVWYQTWDFIKLDHIVTPAVGLLAVGSGMFFLYKYWTTRGKLLTCDVTSPEHQQKVHTRIEKIVHKPFTIIGACAVIGIALSVNIIEFACSIGIPQAFTKILELNELSFFSYQGYTALYTLFYMADDVIVFALAIWGYQKFYAVGQKYSLLSTLIAGILMLILGAILLFFPDFLSF